MSLCRNAPHIDDFLWTLASLEEFLQLPRNEQGPVPQQLEKIDILTSVGTHMGQLSSNHPTEDGLAIVQPMILLPFVQKEILVHIRAQHQLNWLMEDFVG